MMIDYELDKAHYILEVRPEAPLEVADFVALGKAVDPEIAAGHDLNGLIIDAPHFPGWDGLGALMTHLRFVRQHHEHVKKIAVVTDSQLGKLAEHLASHFMSAVIRQFPAGQIDRAREWIDPQHA